LRNQRLTIVRSATSSQMLNATIVGVSRCMVSLNDGTQPRRAGDVTRESGSESAIRRWLQCSCWGLSLFAVILNFNQFRVLAVAAFVSGPAAVPVLLVLD